MSNERETCESIGSQERTAKILPGPWTITPDSERRRRLIRLSIAGLIPAEMVGPFADFLDENLIESSSAVLGHAQSA